MPRPTGTIDSSCPKSPLLSFCSPFCIVVHSLQVSATFLWSLAFHCSILVLWLLFFSKFRETNYVWIHAWLVGVVTCPSVGARKGFSNGLVFHWRKTRGVATNIYLRKTSEKWKRRWSVYFENEGSRVVYAQGRYWHPTHPSQGTEASNRGCKMTLKLCFSLFMFFMYFSLFIFFYFLGSTRVLPSLLRILGCNEEIRPT